MSDEIDIVQIIKSNFNEKIEKGRYLKKIIKNYIEKGNIDAANPKIIEYKKIFPYDVEMNSIEMMISFMKNDLERAEEIALNGLEKVPFNFDLLYNLAYIYELKKKHQKSVDTYIQASKIAKCNDEIKDIEEALTRLKRLNLNLDFSKISEVNPKLFPLKTENETYIGKSLFSDKEEGYFVQYNEGAYLEDYPVGLWNFYKTEILYGKKHTTREVTVEANSKSVLPISVLEQNTEISLQLDGKTYDFNNFRLNRFYYIPIESQGKIKIKSNNNIIISEPINLVQNKKHEIKLSLCLFIDGLSQVIFEKYPMEDIMPNTYNFFSKGTIFMNCYSNGEWTLPSIASVFSGKYQSNHKVFHPELPHVVGDNYKILSEYFQKDDYFTFQACGDWRKSPSYGYTKGFDRTIYQSASMGGLCEDIIFSFLENMRSFNDRDHFAWLSFFELHRVSEGLNPDISVQVGRDIKAIKNGQEKHKSVYASYDQSKIERYVEEIKRLDFYLKFLYDFIEENYSDDEILISLCSDHGQSYLDDEEHILRDCRTKVPFMIRGRNISFSDSTELIENVDILPMLLKCSGLDIDTEQIDGRVPKIFGGDEEKEFVYSESIYPGKTYKAIIRDREHRFIFESEGNVQQDGRIELGDYKVKLENIFTDEDEIKKYPEKTTRYFDVIISHISSFLII